MVDFRQIAVGDESVRAERLFRAAVAAFCSLTRPTRLEITQLDRLSHPLFDRVSPEARRFAAAALSDSPHAPRELVLRLAAQPSDVAAPLLMRSPMLNDVDLVGLIARHGLDHAQIIARRRGLNPAIARLVTALSAATSSGEAQRDTGPAPRAAPADVSPLPPAPSHQPAEQTRQALRAIMSGQSAPGPTAKSFADAYHSARGAHALYRRFRASLLARDAAGFHGAIMAATGIDERSARAIAEAHDYEDLMAILRHIGLDEEQAFLLVSAAAPGRFATTGAIRAFLEDFRRLGRDSASLRIAQLKADAERRTPRLVQSGPASPTNGADALRAS